MVIPPEQHVHALVGVPEVELLLALGQAERLRRRCSLGDRRRKPELAGEEVHLALVEAGDRLDVGQPVAALDEEPLVVLEEVRRADDGVPEPIGPGVLEELPHALLHVRRGDQLAVGLRRQPPGFLGAVRALDDEGEEDGPARGRGADELVPPARLVVREDVADRVVAAPVAAEPLERRRDRLLDRPRAERLRQLEPEIGRGAADVALGQSEAEHVLGAERAHADRGHDPGVDSARDGDDGAAPPQAPDGRSGLLDEAVEARRCVERNA